MTGKPRYHGKHGNRIAPVSTSPAVKNGTEVGHRLQVTGYSRTNTFDGGIGIGIRLAIAIAIEFARLIEEPLTRTNHARKNQPFRDGSGLRAGLEESDKSDKSDGSDLSDLSDGVGSREQGTDCVLTRSGSDRSVLFARTSCSGVNRPRQSTQPIAPGPGWGLDRVSGREIFVQVRRSGPRIASEIPPWPRSAKGRPRVARLRATRDKAAGPGRKDPS